LIPVAKQPEPAGFDSNVRKRGKTFLGANQTPKSAEFKPHEYWKWAAAELYAAYHRICAYSCMYIPTPNGTLDHFLPKTRRPDLAYEWSNYRLALHKLNTYKADNVDIADPFTLGAGWFLLDFPSCLVRPGDGLTGEQTRLVENTIKVLRLNDDDSFVQERCDIMVMFAKKEVGLGFLAKRYPFLAAEVVRQGIQQSAGAIFVSPLGGP
jgi:hypothetical protein